MKVALTGASGFIGRHVLAELATRDVDIVAVTRSAKKLDARRDKAQIVEVDIAEASPRHLDLLAQCDVLIHLAWDGLPNYKSSRHVEIELPRQYAFLKALVERGLPALLITGTCFEYGMQSGALSEEHATLPSNPYGAAKDTLRKQMQDLVQVHKTALTWARLFYTYGAGQSETSLYTQLTAAVARGDKRFDMSGGEQLRDYLPIGEVARLIVELAAQSADAQIGAGPINVCAGQPISVRALVEGWLKENAWEIELNLGHYPYPDYEPMSFWGARSKLDRLLEKS